MYSDGYSIYMILLNHLYIIKKFQDAQFIHLQARFLPTQGGHSQVIHRNENVPYTAEGSRDDRTPVEVEGNREPSGVELCTSGRDDEKPTEKA